MFYALLKLAIKDIFVNRKQSALTMLGIVIGIASVIAVFSVGSGAQSLITGQIQQIGTNLIAVIPGKSEEGGGPPPIARGIIVSTLKTDDAEAIDALPDVEGIVPIVLGSAVTVYENNTESLPYWGTGYRYPEINEKDIALGRYFNEREEDGFARVIVLGSEVKDKLFGNVDPIGKSVKLNGKSFKVVGVLAKEGGGSFLNQDQYNFIPYKTAQKQLLGIDYLHVLRFKAKNAEVVGYLQETVTQLLRRRHKITDPDKDDFTIRTQEQALDVLGDVTSALRMFLTMIAGISLLVGGVGIMNMMLVNVTRRTREIGLRKAVGAKRNAIITQFLLEAGSITLIGGIIGVILGVSSSAAIAFLIQSLDYDWALVITPMSIVISTTISLVIGLVFGLYPAIKAARLDPINALRYE